MTTETGSLPAETQITAGHEHLRLRTDKAEVPGSIPGSPTTRFPSSKASFLACLPTSPLRHQGPGAQTGVQRPAETHLLPLPIGCPRMRRGLCPECIVRTGLRVSGLPGLAPQGRGARCLPTRKAVVALEVALSCGLRSAAQPGHLRRPARPRPAPGRPRERRTPAAPAQQ